MGWFYNKEIFIYTYGYTDDIHGIARKKYTKVITTEPALVDIQPYSSEKAKKDYGYDIETTKRLFIDINSNITESAVIKYKNQFYSIQKVVEWDDYFDIMLLERSDIHE